MSFWAEVFAVVSLLLYLGGTAAAVHALVHARTAQGAVAWIIGLLLLPYLSLPLYLYLGERRFPGYIRARRANLLEAMKIPKDLRVRLSNAGHVWEPPDERLATLEKLARLPFLAGNETRLLVDGARAYEALFAAIDAAERHILVQFYIFRDDRIGRELIARLAAKAKSGVTVRLIYDEIGSGHPRSLLRPLLEAGGRSAAFGGLSRFLKNPFRLNFRNHRKILVVDGAVGLVGGFNIGIEHLGEDPRIGPWRDTHLRLEGPAVLALQLAFFEDWNWASSGDRLELDWTPAAAPAPAGACPTLIVASGPADEVETCSLMFVHLINSARRRIWLSSPYFVPNEEVMAALQLAGLRGVDVRILIPSRPDHLLVYLSSYSFLKDAKKTGVKVHRYQPGFLHQKAAVIDDDIAVVGTANLDNRSFRINFEVTAVVADREVAAKLSAQFKRDLGQSNVAHPDELARRPWWFRLGVAGARLMAPLQ